jgi:uncharacterized protein with von Willebrand factor type A (vWA) domain
MKSLVYDASGFDRHLWSDYTLAEPAAARAQADGRQRYEAFPSFAAEMFHFFHADEPRRLEEPGPGAEVFSKLDRAMQDVPEVADLRAQTVGNDTWSGVVTTSMIDELLKKVPAPADKVDDIRADEDTVDYLERLLADAEDEGDTAQAQAIEDTLDEVIEDLAAKRDAAAAAAEELDMTTVRQAMRKAAKVAAQAISDEQKMIEAYGVGLEQHSGRQAQMKVGAKLAKIVGGNERLRKIAEFAGRLRRVASEQQRRKPRFGAGERVGRRFGNDLGKLCFRELVNGAPGLRHVFAAKYAERSLACVEKADRQKDHKGPIVMVLDSSGSMSSGDADVWAAAVALAFMDVAKAQKRAFAIVHFGNRVLRVDTFADREAMTPEAICAAVNFFAADGGTNFEDSLNTAVGIIRDGGAFKKADIVMVTDGEAGISDAWMAKWKRDRAELDFACYSILVGRYTSKATNEKFSDDVVSLADAIRDEKAMHAFFGKV